MKIIVNGVVIDNPRSLDIRCELDGDETLEGVNIEIVGGQLRIIQGCNGACIYIAGDGADRPCLYIDTDAVGAADAPLFVSVAS